MQNSIYTNNNCSRFAQPTAGKTYLICKQLHDVNGDVRIVINHVERMLFQRSNISISSKPKQKNLIDQYSNQNIEKELERRLQLIKKLINREIKANSNELYQFSLKSIRSYCESNTLSDHDSFYLHFFLGAIYSHLPESKSLASENYAMALVFALKLPDIQSTAKFINEGKLAKHKAICYLPNLAKGEDRISLENALLSKTYIGREIYDFYHPSNLNDLSDEEIRKRVNLSSCGLNDLSQHLKSIGCTKFSKLVLQLNALDALGHDRFKILFLFTKNKQQGAGNYNFRNTVRVFVDQFFSPYPNNRITLFHELTHKALDRVFDNACCPYFQNDQNAKQSYREAMRQVILNLIEFSSIVHMEKISNMAFNELVQLCFGEKIIFDFIQDKQEPYLVFLFIRLREVFGDGYPVSNLDHEFITNAIQYIAETRDAPAYIWCIEPLINYIHNYVIPEMEKYINEHPCKDRIKPELIAKL